MNRLLVQYRVDVQHPEVSGAEHLEMLQIRDRLAEREATLTSEEQQSLAEADRLLIERASVFHQELLRFLDLPAYRREHGIPPALLAVSGRGESFATLHGQGTRDGPFYPLRYVSVRGQCVQVQILAVHCIIPAVYANREQPPLLGKIREGQGGKDP